MSCTGGVVSCILNWGNGADSIIFSSSAFQPIFVGPISTFWVPNFWFDINWAWASSCISFGNWTSLITHVFVLPTSILLLHQTLKNSKLWLSHLWLVVTIIAVKWIILMSTVLKQDWSYFHCSIIVLSLVNWLEVDCNLIVCITKNRK